jgi:hypothetical protein
LLKAAQHFGLRRYSLIYAGKPLTDAAGFLLCLLFGSN